MHYIVFVRIWLWSVSFSKASLVFFNIPWQVVTKTSILIIGQNFSNYWYCKC